MTNPLKIWLFAGETSGDTYGAELAQRLKTTLGDGVAIAGMGRDKMRAAGVEIFQDAAEMDLFGFWEVIKKLPFFIRLFGKIKRHAAIEKPDLIVFIDYPGFNMRIAERLKKLNIPMIYFISPKVWAWGKGRIPRMAALYEKVMCIFPFEEDFFADTGVKAKFVGHPLVPIIQSRLNPEIVRDPNLFLILPGSRGEEIKYILPPSLVCLEKVARKHPELRFVISASNEKREKQIRSILQIHAKKYPGSPLEHMQIERANALELIQRAGTALAASGTVTLEAAIAGLPLVSVYTSGKINCMIAKLLVKLYRDFFTLANIIMDKCIYEEYLEVAIHPFVIAPALERILPGGERREWVIQQCDEMVKHLVDTGGSTPLETATHEVVKTLKELYPVNPNIGA